jgi:type IV pilus assembly protein PilC
MFQNLRGLLYSLISPILEKNGGWTFSMPRFAYRIGKSDGTILEEKVDAENEEDLKSDLESKGYLVFSVRKLQGLNLSFSLPQFSSRISQREFLIFNQEFSALLRAGLPIIRVIDILVERVENPGFQKDLMAVRQEIKNGSAISDAMAKHPRHFPELYVASLRAGEQSGNLSEILDRFISYLKRMIAVQRKVMTSLSYPSFLVVVSVAVVLFLLTFVMPTFSDIYKESNAQLPQSTLYLMGFVDFLKEYFLAIIAVLVLMLIGFRYWVKTETGRRNTDRWLLKIPLLGSLMIQHNIIRVSRTLSTILTGGIPLVPALGMVVRAVTNQDLSLRIQQSMEQVKEGVSLARAFAGMAFFPRMLVEMVEVGEQTGSLPEMLREIADFQEDELDLRLTRLMTWIEPSILLIMGVFVSTIVIIMYLPIFNLAGTIQ